MTASARLRAMVLLIASSAPYPDAHAYRPFTSTDAAIVDPRHVELEIGYSAMELPFALDVAVRRGLSDVAPDWEVTFGMTAEVSL
jgi:hypothetical protein